MIFVTVGTHEQQFNRLVEYMDHWSLEHAEEVVIQTGFSTCTPQNSKWQQMFEYQEMISNINNARIIITHGGPSSFIMPLQIGKIPIVVPRNCQFHEHVNNHQIDFCNKVKDRFNNIIVVNDIETLSNTIEKYDEIIMGMSNKLSSNNKNFCQEFERIAKNLLG